MINVLASEGHFAEHLAAVFSALPPDARGSFMSNSPEATARIIELGYKPVRPGPSTNPTLVASMGDLRRASVLRHRKVAIMEHGAGQSYGGRFQSKSHAAYAGGAGRDAASLFLHPGPHPAARDRKAYPKARVEIVGSPHLDTLPARQGVSGRVVAFSFHFNTPIAPEARSSFPWIFPAITQLRGRFDLLGHAHPRMFEAAAPRFRRAGIEAVKDFTEVCRRADVYVCDNSSTLFAFAATGRPVVVVNPPWYDRKIDHGLRFWEASGVGVNCNRPEALADAIEAALADTPEQRAKREAALDMVYAYRTGGAKRAADVLMDWAA